MKLGILRLMLRSIPGVGPDPAWVPTRRLLAGYQEFAPC